MSWSWEPGPNGLAAAITCAEAGRSVLVLEAADTIGGGARTAELTLPGVPPRRVLGHPPAGGGLAVLRRRPTSTDTVSTCVHPEVALVHPLDDGRAGRAAPLARRHRRRPRDATARRGIGSSGGRRGAGRRWRRRCSARSLKVPRHPLTHGRLRPARRAAGHARRPHRSAPTRRGRCSPGAPPTPSSRCRARRPRRMGLMLLASGHVAGWPVGRGAARERLVDAMAARIVELGGEIETGRPVRSLADVPESRAVLFDLTPRQLLRICGDALPSGYQRRLRAVPLRPRRVQGRLRAVGAGAVDQPRRPAGRLPAPRWHAAGDRRARRPTSPAVVTRRGRSCWSASRACSTPPARPTASTPSGPTATRRRAPRST